MALNSEATHPTLTESQERWLKVREYLGEHRHELAVAAAADYPQEVRVDGAPLLAPASWIADVPVPLDDIQLDYDPEIPFRGITGTEEAAQGVLPIRADGTRYGSYSEALSELAASGRFENRSTYRLTQADPSTHPKLTFGRGQYFDGIDVGEACAHEYAASVLGVLGQQRLRELVRDPCEPARRPMNVAISTLTLRLDRVQNEATFLLHRRDAGKVGHAGGLFQVLPVGIFQAAGDEAWNLENDFSLWRCMLREFSEELLGEPENRGASDGPIDYDRWPFAARMSEGRRSGAVRVFYLGMGVDPLTFATDILTVAVFDAPFFDELFGRLVSDNEEGRVLASMPFHRDVVDRFVSEEPTQAAGSALLSLAWRHRNHLVR
jgi:hypothetical protein